jgi:hypothetical protein
MTGHTQLAVTPRDRFLEAAAQKELIAFERREREFRRKEKQERAAQLQLPANERSLLSSREVIGEGK